MASRLLRINILSPITGALVLLGLKSAKRDNDNLLAQNSIDARLDVVEGAPPLF